MMFKIFIAYSIFITLSFAYASHKGWVVSELFESTHMGHHDSRTGFNHK